ncbi:2,3-butanediol dehydrogenase [Pseudodonghicola flavimaris]|uniref:2,3-butanediol dehydrogenase n=1 Tax=Pseudodonghicola flavimaris TaxID=3050036 RepID=A0ABT7F5I5_9RHOB|nr:2,3-butanediol dehydrogenase [Pseudodonghicola flavimaris]MDK3019760.1 2,3-butanediol dehydrogenase [Pseudodonghicola flavimaris]
MTRAVFWHARRDLRVEARAPQALRPGEVRLQVALCGICGSDLHEYAMGPLAIPTEAPHALSGVKAPLVIGHEFCGTVREVGAEVQGLARGDRVAVEPEYRCGRCAACARGDYHLCDQWGFAGLMGHGGMAEEAILPAYMLHKLPDAVTFEDAALLEPAAVAQHAINRAGSVKGARCAVIGAGPIGLLLVQLLKLAGAAEITATDLSAPRRDMALSLGADHATSPAQSPLPEGAFDLAFEAVGVQAALDEALRATRKGGSVILAGLFTAPATLDLFDMVNREVSLITTLGYRDVFPALIEMIAEGRFHPSRIVTRTVPMERVVPDGFAPLLSSPAEFKILVDPGLSLEGDLA